MGIMESDFKYSHSKTQALWAMRGLYCEIQIIAPLALPRFYLPLPYAAATRRTQIYKFHARRIMPPRVRRTLGGGLVVAFAHRCGLRPAIAMSAYTGTNLRPR